MERGPVIVCLLYFVQYCTTSSQRFASSSFSAHEAIKPMPSECKNTPDADEKPNIAESGRTFSDSVTMATHLSNRSNNMKLEKRSSMSQLLSQIKDRLPGRKNKGSYRDCVSC